ncbi:MAG: alpha/beta fold hydrolase [Victivallales bacterium]|nr:alpha/beta fold hydrolase [Victivallales bacterium]
MKRTILLIAVLALALAGAAVWLGGGSQPGGKGASAPGQRESGGRFGITCYAGGSWQPLAEALPERLVLLVHGLDEPGDLWRNLAPALQDAGVPVARFDYPNDQAVTHSSTLLGSWLVRLRQRGVKQVVLVAHSMGGLVSREYLMNPVYSYRRNLRPGRVPRVRTLVMVAPPNHGSPMARFRFLAEAREQWSRLLRGDGELLGALADGDGQAAKDLLPGSELLSALNARELPRDVRFAIVAGIVSPLTEEDLAQAAARWRKGLPAMLQGTVGQIEKQLAEVANGVGDGVVSLASTRLAGVDDHVAVPGNHISMIAGPLVAGRAPPPAVPITLDRVRCTWPARFPDLHPKGTRP